LFGEPPDAAGHFKLGNQILAQDDPVAAALSRRQFLNNRLAVAKGEAGA
jgi:hypothetical protein